MVSANERAPHRAARQALKNRLTESISNIVVREVDADADEGAIFDPNPDLIVTLGANATRPVLDANVAIPTVACLLLREDIVDRHPNATAVTVDFSPEVQLKWLSRLLPGRKRVGILFDPAQNTQRVAAIREAAARTGHEVFALEVPSPSDLPAALRTIGKEVDVILGLSDSTVLSPQTARAVLLASFEERIPFVGLSESWVKAGAFYALDRDYDDVGLQCAERAQMILDGQSPRAVPSTGPRRVRFSINARAAKHMKVDLNKELLAAATKVYR